MRAHRIKRKAETLAKEMESVAESLEEVDESEAGVLMKLATTMFRADVAITINAAVAALPSIRGAARKAALDDAND